MTKQNETRVLSTVNVPIVSTFSRLVTGRRYRNDRSIIARCFTHPMSNATLLARHAYAHTVARPITTTQGSLCHGWARNGMARGVLHANTRCNSRMWHFLGSFPRERLARPSSCSLSDGASPQYRRERLPEQFHQILGRESSTTIGWSNIPKFAAIRTSYT